MSGINVSKDNNQALVKGVEAMVHGDLINIVATAVPACLLTASTQTQGAFKNLKVSMPDWWASATREERAVAVTYVEQSIKTHTEYSDAIRAVKSLNDFAAPLLKKEIKKVFALDLDVNQVWLELYSHVGVFQDYRVECFSLLEAALHNFEPAEERSRAFYISQFFNYKSSGVRNGVKGLDITKFVTLCRRLDLGKKYQQHIKEQLGWIDPTRPATEKNAFIQYQKASLKAASYIALLKKDIEQKHYQALLSVINQESDVKVDGKPLWFRGLSFMKMNLSDCLVFQIAEKDPNWFMDMLWPLVDKGSGAGFIVYIPDDPDHPVKYYTSLTQLKARLTLQLLRRDESSSTAAPSPYQQFLSRFVAHRARPAFLTYFTEQLPRSSFFDNRVHERRQKTQLDFLLQFYPLGPARDPWEDGVDLWACLYRHRRDRLLADAGSQAVPTEEADAQGRRKWLAELLDDFVTIVGMAAFVVPPVGVVLLGVTAVNLMNEVLEGIEDLSMDDREAGWAHILGVVEGVMNIALTGLALDYVMAEEMSAFKPVTRPDGSKRLWKPDLSRYRSDVSLEGIEPNSRGQYEVGGKTYVRVAGDTYEQRLDPTLGKWRINHPTDEGAYQPVLDEGASGGVWQHAMDDAQPGPSTQQNPVSSEPVVDVPQTDAPVPTPNVPSETDSAPAHLRYSEYAVEPSAIATLTPNERGIYRSKDGQRFFIRETREAGGEYVYQIRDSFNLNADILDVNIVDGSTNRQTGYWLRRVGPDQWESIGLDGGVGPSRLINAGDVREWNALPAAARAGTSLRKFARRRGLFYPTFNRYVLVDGAITPEGQAFLNNAQAPRVSVTAEHLIEWEGMSARERHETTREGFANQHLIDTESLMAHIAQDGSVNDVGKMLLKHAGGGAYTRITSDHLAQWKTLYETSGANVTASEFALRNDLNPVLWGDYVKPDGSFTKAGLLKFAFEPAAYNPLTNAHLARWWELSDTPANSVSMQAFVERNQIDPAVWARYVDVNGKFTVEGRHQLIFGDEMPSGSGSFAPESGSNRPFMARKSAKVGVKRSAQGAGSSNIKVPKKDVRAGFSGDANSPLFGHEINNDLPILQDPNDVTRSLTTQLEGDVDEIVVTYWNRLLADVPTQERLRLQEKITWEARDWVRDEGHHKVRFDSLMKVAKLNGGPERGLSVIARRNIKRFEVLGPYSGKLHQGDKTLLKEIAAKGHKAVESYSFSTFSNDGTQSAYGSGNTLSLINSHVAPGRESLGADNVSSISFGRYMTFFVAWSDIEKGAELLLDYGPAYKWD